MLDKHYPGSAPAPMMYTTMDARLKWLQQKNILKIHIILNHKRTKLREIAATLNERVHFMVYKYLGMGKLGTAFAHCRPKTTSR